MHQRLALPVVETYRSIRPHRRVRRRWPSAGYIHLTARFPPVRTPARATEADSPGVSARTFASLSDKRGSAHGPCHLVLSRECRSCWSGGTGSFWTLCGGSSARGDAHNHNGIAHRVSARWFGAWSTRARLCIPARSRRCAWRRRRSSWGGRPGPCCLAAALRGDAKPRQRGELPGKHKVDPT